MKWLIPLLVLVIAVGASRYDTKKPDTNADTTQSAPASARLIDQEGGIAFEDLTIPYLRNRKYESQLGELKPYGSGGNYNSYLTHYVSDGLKINGLLTIPKEAKPADGYPAVIFVHGYIAPTIYRTTEKYMDYVDYLARNGLVVFKIDLRGHGESEGEPGGAYYSSDYVVDTLNARAALQSSEMVNPGKIGLWGHSMAGNVTFRAFVAASDIPAIVTWAGAGYTYADLQKYGIDDDSYRPPTVSSNRQRRREELRRLYGEFSQESEFWRQVTPANYLEGVKGAVQVHHATDDPVVNAAYGQELMRLLDTTPIPHELHEYPSGGHNLSGPAFGEAMRRTVEFFRQHLIN